MLATASNRFLIVAKNVPTDTIRAYARSICSEAEKYGFKQIDMVRLINSLMDLATKAGPNGTVESTGSNSRSHPYFVSEFPLRSARLEIRRADPDGDMELLSAWIADKYGQHFLLSCATAQSTQLSSLLGNPRNDVGIVIADGGTPIGAVAFLDVDQTQKRAELRKLIGAPQARGQGFAEEATRLWVRYGGQVLGLEKIYVSTLQTHLRNIQLNESIGFRVEGLLRRDVLIAGSRHDVLRMGLCFDEDT